MTGWTVGVDIGGTFTDVVLAHDGTTTAVHKVRTTPADPVAGVVEGVAAALAGARLDPGEVTRLVHATTLATNLVLEGRGARVVFATTEGFGDLLRVPRGSGAVAERAHTLVGYVQPGALVPRSMTVEVPERMAANGEAIRPLDAADADRTARRIARLAPEAIAVCLLHSYADDTHEVALAEACRRAMPEVPVHLSSVVSPSMREYGRAVTTVVAAYVGPAMAGYLARLRGALDTIGLRCPVHVMESGGGVMPLAQAAARAVQTLESGPAAGVVATRLLVDGAGADLLSFDMGGTTAKCGLVLGGAAQRATELYVGGRASAGGRRAGGYPIRTPVIDLAEVGAGGGSIAWVDAVGGLQVGPRSAGAVPGPASYGGGGTEPTVTDANVVLGYVNPHRFLGPAARDAEARAHAALRAGVADPLGISVIDAAAAVYQLVTSNMAAAVRLVTIERGLDPRDLVLVGFGGCGPVHVAELARTFDIERVLVPAHAGVRSAVGLLGTDLSTEQLAACAVALDDGPAARRRLRTVLDELEASARAQLDEGTGGPARRRDVVVQRMVEVRYRGQAHQLVVPVPDGPIGHGTPAAVAARFFAQHQAAYGVGAPGPTEVVNARVRAERRVGGASREPATSAAAAGGPVRARGRQAVPSGHRPVWFDGHGVQPVAVHDWAALQPGRRVAGPAVIDAEETTVVVPPRSWAALDTSGGLHLGVGRAG